MKVKELIEKLQQEDQEALVIKSSDWGHFDLSFIHRTKVIKKKTKDNDEYIDFKFYDFELNQINDYDDENPKYKESDIKNAISFSVYK